MVLARDRKYVDIKIRELTSMGVPYVIVCGESLNHPNVVYRKPMGKYDAINFGAKLIPKDIEVVALNDADTKIHNLDAALNQIRSEKTNLVFVKTIVVGGPQNQFYTFEDSLRRRLLIAADGELMLVKYRALQEILPLKPCKAEDTYILFRLLRLGSSVTFCEDCYVETERTKNEKNEEVYKRKTTTGIYQALFYAKPPPLIILFYSLLPLMSPMLMLLGKKGYYWMRGILLGFLDFLCGDRSGIWQTTYKIDN